MLGFFAKNTVGFFGKNWVIFSAEWTYLLTTRKVGDEDSVFSYVRIKYGENATDTVTGVIIYPDDFSFSEAGVASMPFGARNNIQQINAADWEALENVGCIFLPYNPEYSFGTTGTQSISEDGYYGNRAIYHSASAYNASSAFFLFFNNTYINPNHSTLARSCGKAVRLVQDLE